MAQFIKPLKNEQDVGRVRAHLSDRPKDLFIFDLLTQTGMSLGHARGLKMKDLASLGVGDPISVAGVSINLTVIPRLTRRLRESFIQYVRAYDLKPENYLLMSRKGHKPLSPPSVSRLVGSWFRELGLTDLTGVKSLRKTWEVHYKDYVLKVASEVEEPSATGRIGELSALTLSDQVEARLIDLIVTGQIAPGSRLIISELASEMGISAMPVRDALTRLAAGGIVNLGKNRGYTVNVVSEAEFIEITDLRRTLEPIAAVAACQNARPDNFSVIFKLAEKFEESLEYSEPHEGLKANENFHFSLYRLAKRPVLLQFLEKLWRMVSPYYHLLSKELISLKSRKLELGDYYQNAITNHLKIVESLKNRNSKELAKWIKADIDHSAKKVLSDFYNRQ